MIVSGSVSGSAYHLPTMEKQREAAAAEERGEVKKMATARDAECPVPICGFF